MMGPATVALVSAATLTAGAYLNAKLALGIDLQQLKDDREWAARLGQRITDLGEVCSLYGIFQKVDPNLEALWFEGKSWTYGQLKEDVARLAAYFESIGISKGDTIAVMTTNSPEMVICILALSKIGAVAGLININLRGDTLEHCLKVSTAQTVVVTPDLTEFVPPGRQHFSLNLYSFENTSGSKDPSITPITFDNLPRPSMPSPPAKSTPKDVAILIYTSGTTGKPKACAIRNHQLCVTSTPLPIDTRNPAKYFPLRTYSPLPLFHGTALFTGVAYVYGCSGTLCLARKFSVSRFFQDVTESKATRILYVGELCRYLVLSPPSKYDRAHQCILACGNGLRAEIWETFRDRFGIPEIREFYRSTEGVAKYDNFGKAAAGAGKVGFAGALRRRLEKDTLIVKIDPETETPYRDPKTGFCLKAKRGEAGEVIGRVKSLALLTEYLNNAPATQEKILRDVFEKGDCFQKMGDLLVQDSDGWIRFHDRMGDTFRWKGENVSAGEVRDHIAKIPGVQDAVVYGVKLDKYDGQAGAAAITLDSNEHSAFMSTLHSKLKKSGLPGYAIPRLVRIQKEIETNATFKKSKGDLIKKSWIESETGNGDKLYWLNGNSYQPLSTESWMSIESGRAKL